MGNANWCVLVLGANVFGCSLCKTQEQIQLPLGLKEVSRKVAAFTAQHRACLDRVVEEATAEFVREVNEAHGATMSEGRST